MTTESVLASLWGYDADDGGMWPSFRAPLPPTERFPLMARGNVRGEPIMCPPYILASQERPDGVRVMLTDGSGQLAGMEIGAEDPYAAAVYIGDASVPEEWKEPIEAALVEVRRLFPGATLLCTRAESAL